MVLDDWRDGLMVKDDSIYGSTLWSIIVDKVLYCLQMKVTQVLTVRVLIVHLVILLKTFFFLLGYILCPLKRLIKLTVGIFYEFQCEIMLLQQQTQLFDKFIHTSTL